MCKTTWTTQNREVTLNLGPLLFFLTGKSSGMGGRNREQLIYNNIDCRGLGGGVLSKDHEL